MTNKVPVLIIVLTYFSLFELGLTDNLRGSLFPAILSDFSLSNTQGAWFFILTSLFSIAGGFLSHRISQRLTTLGSWKLGVLFMAFGSFIIFYAPHFEILLLGCATLGLGFGLLGVTQNVIITESTQPPMTKKILSGLHSMYGFASCLSPWLVGLFLTSGISWRYLFLGASLSTMILLIISAPVKSSSANKDEKPNTSQDLKTAGLNKSKLLFSFILASYVAMELLISTRLTTYLTQSLQWTLGEASRYLTFFFIALLIGRLLFSIFHPPLSTKKILFLALMGSMLSILFGLRLHPIYLCLSGLFMAPFYPLAMSLLSELFPDSVSSTIGFTISLQSAFVIVMNIAIGWLTDDIGIASAMYLGLGFGGLSWFLLMKLKTSPI